MRNHAFDVVVVGAGAAGCVVAARLAESRSRSVLLLEAGPDLRASTPAVLRDGWNITGDFDWGLESEPDGRGVVDSVRRCRLVGGTSWRTRFTLRGSPADFEEWVALGNPGWGFDDVLPYFKRLEADVDFPDQPWHGDAGPIPVDRYREIRSTEVNEAAVAAMVEAGLPAVEDHNRPGAVGVGRIPMSGRAGERVTVADAYLPIDDTPANLTVLADVHASHVVFEGSRARGVQLADGRIIDAGWVVVAAGTFGSPSVLMRSGIGPAAHLQSVGVATLVDLPGVGANLADHPGFGFDCGYTGTGRTAPILHSIGTFHSSRAATSEPPDLMFWVADPQEDEEGRAGFDLDVVLLKPRSRGAVRLRSADPTDPPRVDLPEAARAGRRRHLGRGLPGRDRRREPARTARPLRAHGSTRRETQPSFGS